MAAVLAGRGCMDEIAGGTASIVTLFPDVVPSCSVKPSEIQNVLINT